MPLVYYPLAGINRFVECLGVSLTKRILVASEELAANTLLQIGFLDHLVLQQNLAGFATDFAGHIAGLAPLAVQSMKSLLRQAAVGSIDPELARELSARCLASQDLQEGFAAKREKRNPRFGSMRLSALWGQRSMAVKLSIHSQPWQPQFFQPFYARCLGF